MVETVSTSAAGGCQLVSAELDCMFVERDTNLTVRLQNGSRVVRRSRGLR